MGGTEDGYRERERERERERVLNDKAESKNNTIVCGYYQTFLKEYGSALIS